MLSRITDGQYRWLVVGYTLVIQAFTVGIVIYCFALFVVPWAGLFDAPRRDVLLAISLLQISTGVVSPVIGRMMDGTSIRTLVFAGMGCLVVGLVLASRATALWQLLAVYASFFALAMVLMGTLASQTLITRWFDEGRGLALGISATGTNIGGVLFPWLVGSLLLDIGWRDTFLWLAVLSAVIVAPVTWSVLKRTPPSPVKDTAIESAPERVWTSREILTARLFWVPILAIVPLNVAFSAVQFNIGAFAMDFGYGEAAATFIMTCSIMMVIGKFFFGGVGDRIDHRVMYWLSAGFMVAGLLLLRGQPSYGTAFAAIICVGLSGGAILPMLGIVFGSRFGVASFGRVMGFAMLGITTGALGPIVAGSVYDATGSYDAAFLGAALLFAPGAVLMTFLPPSPPPVEAAYE